MEQDLLTHPEHPSSLPFANRTRVVRSFAFCIVFCRSLFVLLSFFFCHCVVCSSLIYGFWLLLWYLLVIVLSVLLWFTASDYSFGIFWSLCCLFFFDLRLLITPLVSSNSSLNFYDQLTPNTLPKFALSSSSVSFKEVLLWSIWWFILRFNSCNSRNQIAGTVLIMYINTLGQNLK